MPVIAADDRPPVHHSYVAVGHVAIDTLASGDCLAGGSALYGALLAARCGLDAAVVTAGNRDAIARHVGDIAGELDIFVQDARATSVIRHVGSGKDRRLTVAERAPDIRPFPVDARILHLAPVLREVSPEWLEVARARLRGLTPQGLVRHWTDAGVISVAPDPLLDRFVADAVVLSVEEKAACQSLLERLTSAVIVITDGDQPAEMWSRGVAETVTAVPSSVVDDRGAGDVFAAALFVELEAGAAPREAVEFAHAAASLKIRAVGPVAVPERSAINHQLQSA